MREIDVSLISETVAQLCIDANQNLPDDIRRALDSALAHEHWPTAQSILRDLVRNYTLAHTDQVPICQDTGMACVFVELGQDVHLTGGLLSDAVDAGVRQGYADGYLRKSVVADPLRRTNTGDNTPAMLHVELVAGDRITITVAPKGFGSENMSQIKMLRPSDGLDGVRAFVLGAVEDAGPNPCPPIVVGVGIGGTFDQCALLAKKALLRPVDVRHADPFYATLETELLGDINRKGIGPQGFGGGTTALGLTIETLPTHIAGLPCAVNISCHVTRRKTAVL